MLHFNKTTKANAKTSTVRGQKTKNDERRAKRLGRTGRRSAASIGGATGFSSSATEGRLLQKGKNWENKSPKTVGEIFSSSARAVYCNLHETDTLLSYLLKTSRENTQLVSESVSDTVRLVFGPQFWNDKLDAIESLGDFLYFAATTGSNSQTLGEGRTGFFSLCPFHTHTRAQI